MQLIHQMCHHVCFNVRVGLGFNRSDHHDHIAGWCSLAPVVSTKAWIRPGRTTCFPSAGGYLLPRRGEWFIIKSRAWHEPSRDRLVNLYQGEGGVPSVWKAWLVRITRQSARSRVNIRFSLYFQGVSFTKNHEELSYKPLSEARMKREGCNSQVTWNAFSNSVTARCPKITPHDWRVDVADS